MNTRMPCIGDLIVHKDPKTGITQRVGLVHRIDIGPWGHGTTFIEWSGDDPQQRHRRDYGYPSCNIFNLRREFDVIRGGVNIP
jgi:hypothetical protein